MMKVRFDMSSFNVEEPKSSADLKNMKGELDEMSKLLKTGRATELDKENMSILSTALRSCLKTRSLAEKASAGKVDTKALLEDKESLSKLMANLKSFKKDSKEYAETKAKAIKVHASVKDSFKIASMRSQLESRTRHRASVDTHIERNLESARKARQIVVCFMVDCTSSMGRYIDGVRDQIKSAANQFLKIYSESSIHFAFLGYRDLCDSEQFLEFDFVQDVEELIGFVNLVGASGGGDTAEDVVGALRKVQTLNWDIAGPGSSRILIHIADAPAHGSKYHDGTISDDYAKKDIPNDADGKNATPPLRYLKAKKVHYFFARVNSSCDTMIKTFNRDVGSEYVTVRELSDVTRLGDTVLKTLSTSVMRTVASARESSCAFQMGSRLSAISEFEEDDGKSSIAEPAAVKTHAREDIKVSSLPAKHATMYCCHPPSGLGSLQTSGYIPMIGQVQGGTLMVRWSHTPFAMGASRWAFYGEVKREERWEPFVMKRLQGRLHQRGTYMEGITETSIAQFLALQYNAARKQPGLKPVRYLEAYVLEWHEKSTIEYCFAEPELPRHVFNKWSNNAGDWDLTLVQRSLLEFAKYTYDATGGCFMVSDLQGVETEDEFVLTDPALLCIDKYKFGATNLGPRAMQAFYEKTRNLIAPI